MKKFFTLCLAFMLASLLNMNAADTYTLVGNDINGASWDTKATQNDFVYDSATQTYVLSGAKVNGDFKIVKNHNWGDGELVANPYGVKVPVNTAYRMYYNGQDGCTSNLSSNGELTNCTVKLQFVGTNNDPYVTIETESTQYWGWDDDVTSDWGIIGNDAIVGAWGSDVDLKNNWNSTYTWKTTTLPKGGFKFRENDAWTVNFGAGPVSNIDVNTEVSLGFNTGDITFNTPSEEYALYEFTLTIRGGAAKLKVVGYKDITPSTTTTLIDLTAQGYADKDVISTVSDASNTITATFDKGSNSNTPKWYNNGQAVRLYGGGSLTISAPAGQVITGISFTYGSSDNSNLITADSGTFDGTAWTGNANSVKFTIDGTTGHRRFAKINVTYGKEGATEYPDWLASIDLSDGGLYYYNAQYNVTNNNADSFIVEVIDAKTGNVVSSNSYSSGTLDAGEWIVKLMTYKGTEMCATTYSVKVEPAELAWSLSEFIGKEGFVKYTRNTAYVTYQNGPNLYLKDSSGAMLVYSYSLPTFQSGDMLDSFIGTYKEYNGTHEIIPVESTFSSFGNWGAQEPEVITLEQVTAENQNKYVKLENVSIDYANSKIGTVALYDKFKIEGLADVDPNKKYDVIGIIGVFEGNGQFYPISFTVLEEKIEPFTYTEIVPANNAEVTSLSEIKITFPYDVTYDAEVSVLVMDGGNMITPTVAVEGNVATLTFDAITAYGSKPSLMVMAGAFKEATSGVGCQQIMAAWSIPTPPVRADYMPINIDPADGSVVESIKNIYFYFDDENPCVTDKGYDAPYKGYVTVKDGNGNAVASDIYLDVKKVSGQWVGVLQPKYGSSYTEPGTYVITLAEGLFSDQQYYDEDGKKGRVNPEFTITYTIKAAALAAPTVDPANGAEVDNLNTITLSFAEAVTANAEAGAITLVNNSNQNLDYAKNIAVAISEDGLTATITSEPSLGAWTAETYTMSIPAGYFVATSGAANEALSYNWKVVAPKFTYVAVDPAQGEVESLETIFIDFGGFRPRLIDGFTYPTYNLVNANGETVTTAATNYSYEQIDGSYYYKLKVTLGAKVTTPGDYFLTIPAGVFKDKDVYSGYNENAEMTFKWTVMEPDPNTYTLALNADPASGSTVSALDKITFTPGAGVMMFLATDEAKVANWAKVTDANGNSYNSKIDLSGQYYALTIEGATAPGTYTVVIPKKSFYDALNATNFNDEIVLTYTVEVAALAAPTVDPANGAEVDNLNTITLTFAEAVTANAEAGAITLVRNSDAAYDKQEAVVTISEDGLTATLTCKPVYPSYDPKWYIGETYTMSIPEGYFVATSGAANEALSYNWKIAAAKFTYVDVTPAQGEVTELSEILIGFANRAYGNSSLPTLNLVDADGNVVTTATTVRAQNANGDWYAIKATLKDKVTAPGTYTLVVPADVFKDVDFGSGTTNAAFDLTWTVMEPDPNTYDLALTSDPANGATVTELKTIKISAADASVIAMPTTEAQSAGWFTIKDAEGNSYNYTANVGVGIEINIEGATALGTYTVVVPAKSFVDAMTMTAASKRYNAEMVLTYTLQEEEEVDNTVYDYAPVTVSPANGSEVESLEKIYVSFPYGVYDCLWAAKDYSKDFIQVSDENGNTYEAKIGYGSYTEDYYIYVKDATAPGTYTIVVPKGLVFDEEHSETYASGHANPEFTLTYTIVAPVVEDFTPVVNPAAGNVTVDQIKTTVLLFESPIASFDGSNVGLRHQFGGPWYDYAATGTISEDKLSMTIVWDFSPTVGTTYTLKLPAGCIVLENGAKNLETNVVYTVVAGPKDLAEFVVPAGINGYINYDETDVNAWAPEFPFTVSTTAYNTVAFTAELPSLPAGITAMEVIDENGEVIATLNQDGVAPLADGEIYYVKGETTKEYVDGAELKFRFRFTHLGVSETIQFSYIVAGGNITSIADVELDGNVIVRGNDIIAPQGAAIFTVSGIRVPAEGLAPGVYVVVLGNQAVKVMVK